MMTERATVWGKAAAEAVVSAPLAPLAMVTVVVYFDIDQ